MNPFDLAGPSFLLFYCVISIVGISIVYTALHFIEKHNSQLPDELSADPYGIAFFRKGPEEALRIATIALMDRGLLQSKGKGKVATARTGAVHFVKRKIEKAVLSFFVSETEGYKIVSGFKENKLENWCSDYKKKLEDSGLISTAVVKNIRLRFIIPYIMIELFFTIKKIIIALERGHHNIIFLILLTFLFLFLATKIFKQRLTTDGKIELLRLRKKFAFLKDRAKALPAGGETNDASFVAAIFGLQILSSTEFPFVKELFPRATSNSSPGGCGGGCSGGGGGGGGCGGGGCGGGCGGCG